MGQASRDRRVNISQRYYIELLGKALDVIDALGRQESELRLTEIAAATQIDKSTVFRILHTLEKRGVRFPEPACLSIEDESRFLQSEVKYLLSHLRYSPSEICIMARNDFYRQMALKALQEVGIPTVHYRAEADEPADIGRVRVSSLHSGKGHEYSAVLIPGMIEGVFPQTRLDQFELQDERAVLYVGMTRARDIVYLSFSEKGDKGHHLQRSRFLDEIAPWCEELVASRGGAKEANG